MNMATRNLIDNTLLLFSVDNVTLSQKQQQILEALGGFRAVLTAATSKNVTISISPIIPLLSPKQYDPAISPFINESTDILCDLVDKYSWSYLSKLNEFKPTSIQSTIAGIIFDFASVWNIWTLPNASDVTCDEDRPQMINWYECDWDEPERRPAKYQTAFIHSFKIDPYKIGAYSCSITKYAYSVDTEIYFGVMKVDTFTDNQLLDTCLGYLQLADGYGYCLIGVECIIVK